MGQRVATALLAALLGATGASGGQQAAGPAESVLAQYGALLEQETLSFTLDQAVAVAVELHPEVRSQRERFAELDASMDEVRADFLPNVDLALSALRTRDPGFSNSPFFSRLIDDGGGGGFPGGDPSAFGGAFTFGTYLWDFQLSQTLWSQGWLSSAAAVRASRERVSLTLAETQNRIARDTAHRVYSWLLSSRTRDVLEEAVRVRERALDVARDRLDFGAGERLDVLRAQVALARLRRDLRAVEETLSVEQAGVNALVGRDQDKAIEVIDTLRLPDPLPRLLPVEALAEIASVTRPAVRQYAKDREILRIEGDATVARLRPEVSGNASFGVSTFALGNTTEIDRRNWTVGVRLNWTLFDGLRTPSRLAALRSQQTRSEWDQSEYEATVEVLLRDQVRRWNDALTAIEDAQLALEETREAYRIAAAERDAGYAIELMVMEASHLEREVELDMLRSTHDALAALAEVKFLVGFHASAPHSVVSDVGPAAADGPLQEEK